MLHTSYTICHIISYQGVSCHTWCISYTTYHKSHILSFYHIAYLVLHNSYTMQPTHHISYITYYIQHMTRIAFLNQCIIQHISQVICHLSCIKYHASCVAHVIYRITYIIHHTSHVKSYHIINIKLHHAMLCHVVMPLDITEWIISCDI